ncbi:MAG TPA: hypothetical protein VN651_04920 [Gemmatimonadaceae bacterium]|nr:hypothetical protein [Gemmatimonadaceae bacterium]
MIVAAAAGLAAACTSHGDSGQLRATCMDPFVPGVVTALPSVNLAVKDRAGHGIALGSTVSVEGISTPVPILDSDTTHVFLSPPVGTYTLHVGKPFYRDTSILNVTVTVDECGRTATTAVSATLDLLPDAPAFRSVDILGARFLGEPGDKDTLRAYFDAAPDVSRAVSWRLGDTTIASLTPEGIVTDKCTLDGGTETVTVVPAADTTRKTSARFSVAPRTFCP